MKKVLFRICAVLCVMVATMHGYANVLRVDNNIVQSGDGSEWNKAYKTLTDALLNATDGDEIWVKAGLYQEPTYLLKEGVNVYGGFVGTEKDKSERNPQINLTYLVSYNFTDLILLGKECTKVTEWDGFTFTGAKNNVSEKDKGGAIRLFRNNKLSNSIISYNTSISEGGAIFMKDAFLYGCVVSNNSSSLGAGGIRMDGASRVSSCVVVNNTAGNVGGGLSAGNDVPVIIENCLIANNTISNGNGGGIYIGGSSTLENVGKIINCTVTNNQTTKYSSSCGGVYGLNKLAYSAYMFNCIIWGNRADASPEHNNITGFNKDGSAYVLNCAIEDMPEAFIHDSNLNLTTENSGESLSPCFVNPSLIAGPDVESEVYSYDWTLGDASSCIDKGNSSYWIAEENVDLLGNARMSGASIDMGAYENQSATGINNVSAHARIKVITDGNTVTVIGIAPGELIEIYSCNGALIKQEEATCYEKMTLPKGVYIIKSGKDSIKVVI